MVDRPYQARRKRRPPRLRAESVRPPQPSLTLSPWLSAQWLPALARRRLVRVKGGRSPAQRTLEARQPARTLPHGRMRRTLASGHEGPSGARTGTQAGTERAFDRQDQVVREDPQCGHRRVHGAEHFLAMADRSDQARQSAGPRISINTLNRSAQKLRFWVPVALRAPAPG